MELGKTGCGLNWRTKLGETEIQRQLKVKKELLRPLIGAD